MHTFFFDLGGVLLDFSHERMCENIANFCALSKEKVRSFLFDQDIGLMAEKGELTNEKLHLAFSTLCKKPLDFEALMHAAGDIFSLKEEMPPLLEALKAQGKRLFLLSNTCAAHFLFAKKHFPFLQLFDGYVLSYEVKARKPEREIFEAALRQAKTEPKYCFYTDDVLEFVKAASKLGIHTHHFETPEKLKTVLNQLVPCLKNSPL